jgi:hypothetical protein
MNNGMGDLGDCGCRQGDAAQYDITVHKQNDWTIWALIGLGLLFFLKRK